jgi:uncharacterized protein
LFAGNHFGSLPPSAGTLSDEITVLSGKTALEADLADATVIAMVDEVLLSGIGLLESYPLRASDAIQISSALVWRADLFVSADTRQCAAAKVAGLKVVRL